MKVMWAKLKKPLIIIAYIALAVLLAIYAYGIREDFRPLLSAPWPSVAALMLLSVLSPLSLFISRKINIGALGLKLEPIDAIGLPFVTSLLSRVVPLRVDLLISAAYYKRRYGWAYASFASVVAFENVLAVLIWLFMGVAGLLLVGFNSGVWPGLIWLCMGAAVIALFAALFAASKLPEGKRSNRVTLFAGNAISGFKTLLGQPRSMATIISLLFINAALQAVSFYIAYTILGRSAPVENILVYTSIDLIGAVVAVVPGNIGIKEALMGFAVFLLNGRFADGVLATLIVRVSAFLVYLICGLIFAYPVHRRIKEE